MSILLTVVYIIIFPIWCAYTVFWASKKGKQKKKIAQKTKKMKRVRERESYVFCWCVSRAGGL